MPDLFAPSFTVSIDGARAGLDVEKSITEVQVIHERNTMDHFSLTLVNAYPDLRWTHTKDADVFHEGGGIAIGMGYVGAVQPMFDGEITRISPSFPESGVSIVRIEGLTRLHRLKQTPKTRTFVGKRDSEIATQIANELKLKPDVDPTDAPVPYLIQSNRTDLDFLLERAQRIHYQLHVDGHVLKFKKASDATPTTAYTLVWAGGQKGFEPDARAMPLRSFSPTMNTLWQPTKVIVRGQHVKNRKPIKVEVGDEALAAKAGKETGPQVAAKAGREVKKVVVNVPVASEDEARQIARSVFNDLAADFVTGSGASIGLPELRAGAVIELAGLGDRFDGDYHVTRATHTINQGGYSTSFAVRRNAVG